MLEAERNCFSHRLAQIKHRFETQRFSFFSPDRKKVEKSIAINPASDNFTAPRRLQGWPDSIVCEPITDSQQGQD
jgi:hypothetical protein